MDIINEGNIFQRCGIIYENESLWNIREDGCGRDMY